SEAAVQEDGRIVAVLGLDGAAGDLAVVRFTERGALDTGFGTGGVGRLGVPEQYAANGTAVATAPGGKVLVAGSAYFGDNAVMIAGRLTADGRPDPTFGGTGWAVADLGEGSEWGSAVAALPDGRVVVAGTGGGSVAYPGIGETVAAVRFLADGRPDPTFGNGGVVFTPVSSHVSSLLVQPDGNDHKLVVVGWTGLNGSAASQTLVLRYRSDGVLDPTFSGDGIATFDAGHDGFTDLAYAAALQPNGDVVVAGLSFPGASYYPGTIYHLPMLLRVVGGTRTILPGERLSQGDPAWRDVVLGDISDSSVIRTIGQKGCALTCLAMALRYVGIEYTPPELNGLLVNTADGFVPDAQTGYRANLNWSAASRYAAKAKGRNDIYFNSDYLGSTSVEDLAFLIDELHVPVIVGVNGSSHFVVVTGREGDEFTIADPGFADRTLLSAYENKFSIRGYVIDPSEDISELTVAMTSPSAAMVFYLTGAAGRVTGFGPGGTIREEIPGLAVAIDRTEDELGGGPGGTVVYHIVGFRPESGDYTLRVGGPAGTPFRVAFTTFGPDGEHRSSWEVPGEAAAGQYTVLRFGLDDRKAMPQPQPAPPEPTASPPLPVLSQPFAAGADRGGAPLVVVHGLGGAAPFQMLAFDPSFTGGVRVAMADVTGDGAADLVVGPGPGGGPVVKVFDLTTGPEVFSFLAFEETFTGGVYVAAGDLDGDGFADIVLTPDEGGGPRARVLSGRDFSVLADFFGIEDPAFRGGARAALGDVNGDGFLDLIVAAGFGGGPRVAVWDGRSLRPGAGPVKLLPDFFVFEDTLRNGVFVTAGDLNGDGFAEVIVGGGPGGGPRVFALSGKSLAESGAAVQAANFFAGDVTNLGGVRVAAEDLDGDDRADLLAGAGAGAGSRVTAYAGNDIPADGLPLELFALDALPGFGGGVFVG
ncbi:MAG TPA: FG-GAP-like repeat-containing protein, partial [Gemmataceae bacterium]